MRWKEGTVRWLVGLVACLALVLPTAAWAAEGTEESDPTARTEMEVFGGFPGPLTLGPDGALWFTNGQKLGRIDGSGTFSETPLSTKIVPPRFQTLGPDGDLWATSKHEVDRITGSGEVTRFPLPEAGPIAAASDGALWLTTWARERSFGRAYVIRLRPSGGIARFRLPGPARGREAAPASIVAGPDGDLWFTDPSLGRFGRFTPDGHLTEFHNRLRPEILAPDDAGGLWFVGEKGVGTIDPSGKVREIRVDNGYELGVGGGTDAVTGPEGDLWFIAAATQVMRMTPSGQLNALRLPGPPTASHISQGPGGSIWVSTREETIKALPGAPLLRYQPGFPGIEVKPEVVPVEDGQAEIPLSCGGSSSPCTGEVTVVFGRHDSVVGPYEVAPESEGVATVTLPGADLRRLSREGFERVEASASVADGKEGFTQIVLRAPRLPAPRPGKPLLLPLPEGLEIDGLARAHDGTIWTGAGVGRFTRITSEGELSTIVVPGLGQEPTPIGFDSRGDLWFTEHRGEDSKAVVGKLSPAGKLTQVRLPPGSPGGYETVLDTDGKLWVLADAPHSGEVLRIDPGRKVTHFPIGNEPLAILADRGGGAWFSESGPRIGHIGPNGKVRIFDVPHQGFVDWLALGRHGELWFAHSSRPHHLPPAVGRLFPDGRVVEYPVPHVGEFWSFRVDPAGDLVFTTEYPRGKGRVTPRGKVRYRHDRGPRGSHERTVALV
jgi:streptogramin lyase